MYDPEDVARATIKESTLHPSELANLRGPYKVTIYDPADQPKRTNREVNDFETPNANLAGPAKSRIYDPEDVARTTLKESSLHDQENMNLVGPRKHTSYDPDDKARTTLKESSLHEQENMNLVGPRKQTSYDPDDKARTTLKESSLHDQENMNLVGPRKGPTFDPEDITRRTIKEEYSIESDLHNISSVRKNLAVHDPDDIARRTIKEDSLDDKTFAGSVSSARKGERILDEDSKNIATTLKDLTRLDGHIQNISRNLNGAYAGSEYDAPPTIRQAHTINTRESKSTKRGASDAYSIIDVEAPETSKESTVVPRTGNSGASSMTKAVSYEQMYNAAIDGLKESTVIGRDFVESGSKVFSSTSSFGDVEIKADRQLTNDIPDRKRFLVKTDSQHLRQESDNHKASYEQPPGPFDVPLKSRNYDEDPSRF